MENKQVNKVFLNALMIAFASFVVFSFFRIFVLPNVLYDRNEINYSMGVILVSIKELGVLKSDEIVEFDVRKSMRFSSSNTGMSFKLEKLNSLIDPNNLEELRSRNWKVLVVTDDNILLKKQFQKNIIELNFSRYENKYWMLNASYERV